MQQIHGVDLGIHARLRRSQKRCSKLSGDRKPLASREAEARARGRRARGRGGGGGVRGQEMGCCPEVHLSCISSAELGLQSMLDCREVGCMLLKRCH